MFDELCSEIRAEFPDFQIVKKQNSRLMRFLASFLFVVTFGQARTFLTGYITTLGHTVYTNMDWEAMDEQSKCIVLRHERVHMRQAKKLGRALYSFLYIVPFFPLGLAFWRAKFEQEAYEESIRATVQYRGSNLVFAKEYRTWMLSQFCGSAYCWMWPFPKAINAWFDKTVDKVIYEYIGKTPKPPRKL